MSGNILISRYEMFWKKNPSSIKPHLRVSEKEKTEHSLTDQINNSS